MTRIIATTAAILALVAAPAIVGADHASAATPKAPRCRLSHCPPATHPSPGPFVVVPARPRIPRTER